MTPKLPPLPEPDDLGDNYYGTPIKGFTAEAMNARYLKGYNDALAAIKAQGVPEIDYEALIEAAYKRDRKWAQGTNGCIAFKHGAEWFRNQVLASAPPAPQAQGVPEISTEHGPWVPSNIHKDETYCKRCLLRSAFLGARECEPHIKESAPPAPQASGYGPKMIPQVSGYEEQPDTIAVSSTKQASVVQQEPVVKQLGIDRIGSV